MTHDELNAALFIQRKIERLQSRLDDLRQTGGVGSAGSHAPVQGGAGGFAGEIAAELEQEVVELEEQLKIEQEIIRREINKMELLDIERTLLILRYVKCRPWKLVECSLGYSKRHTLQIHSKAQNIALHSTS